MFFINIVHTWKDCGNISSTLLVSRWAIIKCPFDVTRTIADNLVHFLLLCFRNHGWQRSELLSSWPRQLKCWRTIYSLERKDVLLMWNKMSNNKRVCLGELVCKNFEIYMHSITSNLLSQVVKWTGNANIHDGPVCL